MTLYNLPKVIYFGKWKKWNLNPDIPSFKVYSTLNPLYCLTVPNSLGVHIENTNMYCVIFFFCISVQIIF